MPCLKCEKVMPFLTIECRHVFVVNRQRELVCALRMMIPVPRVHDFRGTVPFFKLLLPRDLLCGNPHHGIRRITRGQIAGNLLQFFGRHRLRCTGVDTEAERDHHTGIREIVEHPVDFFREGDGIDLPIPDRPQTRFGSDAALSAAVGFGTVKIGLIDREPLRNAVVQLMPELISAGTAGIIAAGDGNIVRRLPVCIAEPVERRTVVVNKVPSVV